MLIYHILGPEVWAKIEHKSVYEAESLKTEGFIHCSYAYQLEGVLGRYFSDAGEVVILAIDTRRLTSRLVIEPSTNDELFPHIYGPVNLDAVVSHEIRAAGRAASRAPQIIDA
ncbi:MAG TPA: DUF952 domain-containing protein [Pyrinomonadaceae bacterium]|nr:DUF952 domain-containing protein [Pyrinomonadaceae bacterium]